MKKPQVIKQIDTIKRVRRPMPPPVRITHDWDNRQRFINNWFNNWKKKGDDQ